MPDRPEWDTSRLGVHPKLTAPVTEDEIEAARLERLRFQASEQYLELADSRLRGPDTIFLNEAIKNETAHRANLAIITELPPDQRQARTAYHLRELCTALWQQGKIAEALQVAADDEQRAHILKVQEAIEKPDDADCGCPREVVDGLVLNRRFDTGIKVLSPIHGQVVSLKQCSICGDWNAYPGMPERWQQTAGRFEGKKVLDRDVLKA